MRNTWILMGLAIFFWGVNWPIMKIGLNEIGPLWFATLRVGLAGLVMFVLLGAQGKLRLPERPEWPVLFSVGVVQIGIFMALIHTAVQYVDAGRSAILVYTTPIWVAPLAYIFLSERMNRIQAIGLMCAVLGVVALFNPLTFIWRFDETLFGNALLIGAAVLWAGVIVHVRGFGWTRPHLSLYPWQLGLATLVLLPLTYALEGPLELPATMTFAITMTFNAIFATAFAFWAYLSAAKMLPANTTAMASLGVPIVGITASVLLIDENLSSPLLIGLTLIIVGQLIFLQKAKKVTNGARIK